MTVSFDTSGQVRVIGTVTYFPIAQKVCAMRYGTAEPFRVTPPQSVAYQLSYLPVDYEALAAQHRQVETKFGNAKTRDADTLLRFILLHVGGNLPLRR